MVNFHSLIRPVRRNKLLDEASLSSCLEAARCVRVWKGSEWVSEWVNWRRRTPGSAAGNCAVLVDVGRPTLRLINIHADVFVWRQSRWHDVTWPPRVTKKRRLFWPQRSGRELLSLILNTPNSTLQHVMSSTHNCSRYIGNTEADIQKTTWSLTVNWRPICIRRNGRFVSWWFLTIFVFFMTLTFDLLASKFNYLHFVSKCTYVVNLVKFTQNFQYMITHGPEQPEGRMPSSTNCRWRQKQNMTIGNIFDKKRVTNKMW